MHIVRESISDAIGILDSAPIRPHMFPQMYLLQIGNRIPVAHLAIEHGLKVLIREKAEQNADDEVIAWLDDKVEGKRHSLANLYLKLREVDEGQAKFLAEAFNDAVKFFGYVTGRDGFKHFKSVESYLSRVATDGVFQAMRYWVIEGTEEQEKTISSISPPVHREILGALRCLFFPDFRETVTQRVVQAFVDASFNGRSPYGNGSIVGERKSNSWSLERLIRENASARHVLETAEKMGEEVRARIAILVQAYSDGNLDTLESDDPAAFYFLSTLTYLQSDSQPQDPNAVAKETWMNPSRTSCTVKTPAGTILGWVVKLADGAWAISPMEFGPTGEKVIAWKLKDAKHYLINRLTSKVAVAANGGESRELRVFTRSHRWPFPKPATHDGKRYVGSPLHPHPDRVIYELEFWDVNHGLKLGDLVTMDLQPGGNDNGVGIPPHQLVGVVTSIENQSVSVDR